MKRLLVPRREHPWFRWDGGATGRGAEREPWPVRARSALPALLVADARSGDAARNRASSRRAHRHSCASPTNANARAPVARGESQAGTQLDALTHAETHPTSLGATSPSEPNTKASLRGACHEPFGHSSAMDVSRGGWLRIALAMLAIVSFVGLTSCASEDSSDEGGAVTTEQTDTAAEELGRNARSSTRAREDPS